MKANLTYINEVISGAEWILANRMKDDVTIFIATIATCCVTHFYVQ
jgi:hypothetical protein